MSETKIKPRITFGACGCDGARIAGTARASTRTCEHRPSGAGASLAASSSADMRSPLAVLVARVAVRSKADWGYGRFGEDRGVGNVVASARPSMACGARLRPRDGRGIGATRAVRGRMQMALACPFDVLVRREQIWACTTVATPRCAVHARVVGLRRRCIRTMTRIAAPQGRRNPGITTGAHSSLGNGACWITHWSCFLWAGESALAVAANDVFQGHTIINTNKHIMSAKHARRLKVHFKQE